MMRTAPVVPPIAGWTTQLSCGHSLDVPADGAVLANVASIVHHHLLCPGSGATPAPEPLPGGLDAPADRRPPRAPTVLPAAPPHLGLPAAP